MNFLSSLSLGAVAAIGTAAYLAYSGKPKGKPL